MASPETSIPESPAFVKVDRGPGIYARATVVDLPAEAIFARLVDPHRHHELDGSGTVQPQVEGPHRLTPGGPFKVKMKMFGLPYAVTSTAVAVEENRLVSWRHPAGYIWQWELESLPDGRTQVTELLDLREARGTFLMKLIGDTSRNVRGIEQSLAGLSTLKA
ncbi:MAG: dimethyladenosine transferase [Thermomicrobiales bacterium]